MKVYNSYRTAWNLDADLDYKQIDIFMWTYGKAIKKIKELKDPKKLKNQKILKDLDKLNMSPS